MATEKQWGLTPPMSKAHPAPLDVERNAELVEELKRENNYEGHEETQKRMKTLKLLNQVNREFVREVGRRQGLPKSTVDQLGGKIYPYGSYRLGVYSPGSDIDTLAVAPKNVGRKDFFELFPVLLRRQAGPDSITSMVPVPDAYVPIIKLELNGVDIDLIFASISTRETIPPDFDLNDNKILDGLDEAEVRAVAGPRVTDEMLSLIPEAKTFRTALRAIKLWAKRRAIYANIVGFPGGVAWAILCARVCQMYPNALGGTLVQKFFGILKAWNWPTPVQLKDIEKGSRKTWNPAIYAGDKKNLMPIITPAYPSMCSTWNVTQSNKMVILKEIERASKIANDIFDGKAKWSDLFQKHTFFTHDHKYYISIIAACKDPEDAKAWSGTVESKVRWFCGGLDVNTRMVKLARPFTKATKRYHKCENEDQVKEVCKGSMKYKVDDTETVESTDPQLVQGDGAGTATNNDKAESVPGEGISVYTYTFYVGVDPTALLEQTKSLDIHNEYRAFKQKCFEWPDAQPDKHFLEVVPCKAYMLPDDLFDATTGEVKPQKPVKSKTAQLKRKAANGELSAQEPPTKQQVVEVNDAPATQTKPSATPQPA